MKKPLLLVLVSLFLMTGCADEPGDELPPASESSYSVKLKADLTSLSSTETSEPLTVELASKEDENVKYSFEIGNPAKLNTKSSVSTQIQLNAGAYIKSVSTYKVEKIIVDYFSKQGTNFQVFNNVEKSGEALSPHKSSIAPTDPEDYGAVLEYEIDSNGWNLYNHTEYNKPTFYYVEVIFKK